MNYLIRLFPKAWRDRYGEEFLAQLEMTPATPRSIADVIAYATRSHLGTVRASLRSPTGLGLGHIQAPSGKAGSLATIGLLLVLPSLLFAGLNILEFMFGLDGAANVANQWASAAIAPFLLLGLPALGLAVASVPVLGVTLATEDGAAISARVVLHVRARNLAVSSLAVVAGSVLLLYAVAENL